MHYAVETIWERTSESNAYASNIIREAVQINAILVESKMWFRKA